MGLAYYGVKLSDNWIETPEGYVIFKNATIGRTGFQKYKIKDLDEGERTSQNIVGDPESEVELFRSPEEVFAPRTIASFETKSITDGHPDKLLDLDTVQQHECGQIANVRKGPDALESGDWPLLADLVVKSRALINKIKAGLRELSCGYNYHVLRQGDLLLQVDIVGNHVAVVNAGRAGPEASIKDSLETSIRNGVFNMNAFLDKLLNRPTKSKIAEWAKTATPEEISTAMDALVEEVEKKKDEPEDKAAKDAAEKAAKDAAEKAAKDAASKGVDRKKFHDALDRMLDGKEEEMNAADADMEELKGMFGGKAKDETVAGEETGKETPDKPIETADELEALTIEPADRPVSTGEATDEIRAAYKDGAIIVFKTLKPHIAASKDKKLIGAFDTAVKIVAGGNAPDGTAGKGGYAAVGKAAASLGKDAKDAKDALAKQATTIKAVEDAYAARRNQRN